MQDNATSARFSFRASVADSFRQMRRLLFAPFDVGLWFRLAFCIWLAGLGFKMLLLNIPSKSDGLTATPPVNWQQVHQTLLVYWPLAAGVVLALSVIVLGLWLVMLWFNSRGLFMTLDSLASGRVQIGYSWSYFRRQGQAVFWFRVAVALICFAAGLFFLVAGGAVFLPPWGDWQSPLLGGRLVLLSVSIVGLAAIGLIYRIIDLAMCDVIAPLLYRFDVSLGYAWRWCWQMFCQHTWVFVKYLLCLAVLQCLLLVVRIVAVVGACCCACCVAWIFLVPVVGSYLLNVFLLPLSVWRRYFAFFFLASFGDAYNLLKPVAPPSGSAPAAEAPAEAIDPAI